MTALPTSHPSTPPQAGLHEPDSHAPAESLEPAVASTGDELGASRPQPEHGASEASPENTDAHDTTSGQEAAPGSDEEVEEIPRDLSEPLRPRLPRLNSQTRASYSASPQPSPSPSTKREHQAHGSFQVKDSREIPLHFTKRPTTPMTAPLPLPSPSESDHELAADDEDGSEYDEHDGADSEHASHHGSQEEIRGQNPTIQIPKVTPVASGFTLPPNLTELADGLEGMFVDEFLNILDWSGHVLGRAEGDLPSMVGRPVSATGEILSSDGEVVGYVSENLTKPRPSRRDGKPARQAAPPPGAKAQPSSHTCHHCGHGKPSSTPSPSEIYLDVKSTNDGVQLIIKIPTVFNSSGVAQKPTIHIG